MEPLWWSPLWFGGLNETFTPSIYLWVFRCKASDGDYNQGVYGLGHCNGGNTQPCVHRGPPLCARPFHLPSTSLLPPKVNPPGAWQGQKESSEGCM